MTQDTEQRFEFGRNWHQYITRNFSQQRVETSRQHILKFMAREDLRGLEVLDIGCGSGLHSMAMLLSGAKSVHGFDYDANSVAASDYVRKLAGNPPHWSVEQGSVLDDAYINRLPQYDLVYSWGVLHHTGEVWHAIRNACSRVKPGGLMYIALYAADVQIDPTPEFWLEIKQRYVRSGWLQRRLMDLWYIWRFDLGRSLFRLPQFLRKVAEYKKNRGMSVMTDIRDWLGGWPMEFVYDADAIKACEQEGLKLVRIATGEANTEFLFERPKAASGG